MQGALCWYTGIPFSKQSQRQHSSLDARLRRELVQVHVIFEEGMGLPCGSCVEDSDHAQRSSAAVAQIYSRTILEVMDLGAHKGLYRVD